jgi:hypothetical protein
MKPLIVGSCVLSSVVVLALAGGCGSHETVGLGGPAGKAGGNGGTSAGGVSGAAGSGHGGALGSGGADAGGTSGSTSAGVAGTGGAGTGGISGASGSAGTSGNAGASGLAGSGGGAGASSGNAGAGGGGPPPSLPCDLYAAGGTACVAAHSTTRALLGSYGGKLYQVQRASDGKTADIGTLTAGGYADAAAQDAFCAATNCIMTIIYDQAGQGNHLTISPAGGAGGADVGANAAALPTMAGGHKVYGVYVSPGVGYRNLAAKGTAHAGQPEGMYMLASGKHVNGGCCFDYGNTEQPKPLDTGNGHMDAVYFGMRCEHPPCSGTGPWIAADLENGLFQGNGSNTNDATADFDLVTAMLKTDGQKTFALKTANAQSGGLTTQYDGTLPNGQYQGYIPMSQEGGIVLGVGGDNSNWSAGDFYEGVMTAGYPTTAAEDAVQANIVSVGYKVATYSEVLPTSEKAKQSWKYTTTSPVASWNAGAFNDGAWNTGNGGFGTDGTPGAFIGTVWNGPDIWLRRPFNPGARTPEELSKVILRLHHDEDAEVYINGVQALAVTGYTLSYEYASISKAAQGAIVSNGTNMLAVHCHQTAGGQYIDAGLYMLGL